MKVSYNDTQRISINPRRAVNQGIDKENLLVKNHTRIYNTLLTHVSDHPETVSVSLNPYGTAPLSGYLGVWVNNDEPVKIQVTDDLDSIPVAYDYVPAAGANLVPLLGLTPGAANRVHLTKADASEFEAVIITNPAPLTDAEGADGNGFPIYEVTSPAINPPSSITELYFTAFADRYHVGVDVNGVVRWYTTSDIPTFNFERISNGHFLSASNNFDKTKRIYEFDMVGRVHHIYKLDNRCHHSIYELPNGNLLLPSENTGITDEDGLSIIDRETGRELNYYDIREVLDMKRPPVPSASTENDWLHINQACLNVTNNLILVSSRHQGAFGIKAETGELAFVLANHEDWREEFRPYLLTPVDSKGAKLYDLTKPEDIDKADKEFWSWGHHAILEVKNTTVGIVEFLLFDNGNYRSRDPRKALIPDDNHSRIVHYKVDLRAMTVEKVFEYGTENPGCKGYSSYVSNQNILANGNYFINFGGGVVDENGRRATIADNHSDITDPLVTARTHGMVLLQEIDPKTQELQLELTATPGVLVKGRDFFYSFRSHKLTLI